jgi:TolA-binding protein
MRIPLKTLAAVVLLLTLLGCQSEEQMLKINRDIANLQDSVYRLENQQTELKEQLKRSTESLKSQLEDRSSEANQQEVLLGLRDRVFQLEAQLEDVNSRLRFLQSPSSSTSVSMGETRTAEQGQETGAVASSQAATTSVSSQALEVQFNSAFADFNRGQYQTAVIGFEDLLLNFPESPFSEQAHYYSGRSYFEQSKWEEAATHFESITKNFPRGEFVRPSLLYLGQCYHYLHVPLKAVETLRALQTNYPDSQEARLAGTFLRRLQYQ